jgi:oligoendopeptidase F
MTARSPSVLRKPNSTKSAAKSKTTSKRSGKALAKAAGRSSSKVPGKAAGNPGKLPEWNLGDLYGSIDAPEVARDLARMDADCVAFETDYKGKLAERTAREDGGAWLAEAVKRYEAIDDLAGRLSSFAGLAHAGDSVDAAVNRSDTSP